jgi:pyruvate dehydrogenase E2 component (dihydrolipoamide acetyltransferase)
MPSMGADMTEGTIVNWLKSEGDVLEKGDKIAEIETDKTVVEMETYTSGILKKIIVNAGEKVDVGTLIAFIGNPDDELPEIEVGNYQSTEVAEKKVETKTETKTTSTPSHSSLESLRSGQNDDSETQIGQSDNRSQHKELSGTRVKASPIARKLARENNIDIALVSGTGPAGRITKNDVLSYVPSSSINSLMINSNRNIEAKNIPVTTMRQAIARVTVRSKTEIPHYYVTHEIDMTDAVLFRNQLNDVITEQGDRISVNDLIIKSLVNALIKYPKWNSFFSDEQLVGHSDINIGIAIALEGGLIVPAILGCQNLSLIEISRSSKDIGSRARGQGGTLTQDELTQGTFGTSNLGMFGTDTFAAIIVPPQAGILAVGAIKKKPVVKNEKIVIRDIMNATISADHRIGDGAEAATLMQEIQINLENPINLFR